jgi:hypothetical protein
MRVKHIIVKKRDYILESILRIIVTIMIANIYIIVIIMKKIFELNNVELNGLIYSLTIICSIMIIYYQSIIDLRMEYDDVQHHIEK